MIFALPSISITSAGDSEFSQGSLFELPPELSSNYQLKRYVQTASAGWSRCELGYWIYMVPDEGGRFVVPGLYLTDAQKPRKKIYGYGASFSKNQIEKYVDAFVKSKQETRMEAERELTALVHDLRHLSSSIYHSAIEAEHYCRNEDNAQTQDKLKSVVASQAMLKVRIDYLDFSNSVDRFSEVEDIPVYSRVDKVKRCFSSNAKDKNIDLYLQGESFRLAKGPNILDIVSYTLIENAIKYSPKDQHIEIIVEDNETSTRVSVISLGPKIDEGEVTEIFRRGRRGANAVCVRPSGTGLGLSVAKEIIDIFNGSITARPCGEVVAIEGVPFQRVNFSFEIPTSGEDTKRKSMFERMRSRRKKTSSTSLR